MTSKMPFAYRLLSHSDHDIVVETSDGVTHVVELKVGQDPARATSHHLSEYYNAKYYRWSKRPLVRTMFRLNRVSYGLGYRLVIWGAPKKTQPPFLAECLIALCAPKRTRDALLGDLEEKFKANCEKLGSRRAKARYWLEGISSARPMLFRLAKKFFRWAIYADEVRKYFGH